ncbi:MAG: ketosynthase [Luteimonas sp.]
MTVAVQALLALSYSVLAHLAADRHDQSIGAAALGVLALLILLRPLARARPLAVLLLALAAVGIAWLYRHGHTLVPMLLVPALFMGVVAMWFARSLRGGRVALITRVVSGIEGLPPAALAADLHAYTRALTRVWAGLLGALVLTNLLLALVAVPDGLLAQLGWDARFTVSRAQWSWLANFGNYGILGGFFIAEYRVRKRRFPGRYRNFTDFLRRLAALGPGFWKDFLH